MVLNSQNQFLFFTLLGHIASVNNVVVTVLYLLRALHRRIIYSVSYIVKISKLRRRIKASLATAICGNKQSDCSRGWSGFKTDY